MIEPSSFFLWSEYQLEALVLCLLASVIWAPIVLMLGATLSGEDSTKTNKAPRKNALDGRDRFWTGLLLVAVLPALTAPTFAALGFSLRPDLPGIGASADAIAEAPAPAVARRATPEAPTPSPAPTPTPIVPDSRTTGDTVTVDAMVEIAPTAIDSHLGASTDPSSGFLSTTNFSWLEALQASGLLYFYGLVLAFLLWFVRLASFAHTVRRASPVMDDALARRIGDWSKSLGVSVTPRLLHSSAAPSVCIFGVRRPSIIFPTHMVESASTDDLVLMAAHELAHIKRGDPKLFSATALTRILFWFNPFIRRLASRCELAAEEGADALVLAGGADRRHYATCFVNSLKFANNHHRRLRSETGYGLMAQRYASAFAPIAFTPHDRRGRRRRLDAILSASAPDTHVAASARRIGRRIALSTVVALGGVLAIGQAALAVNPESPPLLSRFDVGGSFGIGIDKSISIDDHGTDLSAQNRSTDEFWNELHDDVGRPDSPHSRPIAAAKTAAPPVPGEITAAYGVKWKSKKKGKKHAKSSKNKHHNGVDIRARRGTPVKAPWDGVVVAAHDRKGPKDGSGKGWGKAVIVDHGEGLITRYAHLDRLNCSAGAAVSAGDIIAFVGSTGASTGPHLHFETIVDGSHVDPVTVLPSLLETKHGARDQRKYGWRTAPSRAPVPSLSPMRRAEWQPSSAPRYGDRGASRPTRYAMSKTLTQNGPRMDVPSTIADFPRDLKTAIGPMAQNTLRELEQSLLGGRDKNAKGSTKSKSEKHPEDTESTSIRYRMTLGDSGYQYELVTNEHATEIAKSAAAAVMSEVTAQLQRQDLSPKILQETLSAEFEKAVRHRKIVNSIGFAAHAVAKPHPPKKHRHTNHRTNVHQNVDIQVDVEDFDDDLGGDFLEDDRREIADAVREAVEEAREVRRDAMEIEREALHEARIALKQSAHEQEEEIAEAFRDIDEAQRDLDEASLSPQSHERAKRAIQLARRQLTDDLRFHKQQINQVIRELEQQEAAINRRRDALKKEKHRNDQQSSR